jgi:2-dehydro-3-deoxyglucarate aldolase/4-hydroxy-2-oxoheptanedioate aldolase
MSGPQALGCFVFELASPAVVTQLKAAGIDFILLDLEHAPFTWREVLTLIQAGQREAMPVIVKVSELERPPIQKALDAGATGIQLARVESAEQVRQLADYVLYPPRGTRAYADGVGHTHFLPANAREVLARAAPLIWPMIETIAGLEHVDEIVSAPGPDAIYVGTYDLSVDLGVPGDFEHPTQMAAVERILSACAKAGVPAVLPSSGPQASGHLAAQGARGFIICADLSLIRSGAMAAVEAHRVALH